MGNLDGEMEDGAARAKGWRHRSKRSKGGILAGGTLLSLGSASLAIIYRASFLEAQALLDATHALFLALALGWIGRCVIHGCVGYFRRTRVEDINPYTLLGVSCINAGFAITWLVVAIYLLLNRSGALLTAAAAILICLFCFLLSLATHWAAKDALRPRASDWVRDRVRDPLAPGGSTLPGWILIKLIDWRSAPHYLSTFVAGTLGLLLVILLLSASAAISDRVEHREAPVTKMKTAPGPSQTDDSVETPESPNLAGLGPRTLRKPTRLLCFIAHSTAPQATPTQLFLCIVMSGERATNQAIILTPSTNDP